MTDQAYDDEFEAAFNEAAGAQEVEEQPEVDEIDQAQPEAEQEEVTASQAGELDELEKLKRERDEWRHRYESNNGRISSYQKQIQELSERVESAHRLSNNGQEAREALAQEANGSSWEEFAEDFPEIAEALDSRLRKIEAIEQRLGSFEKEIQPIKSSLDEQTHQRELAALQAAHPDWQDVARSSEFKDWIQEQPAPVRDLVHSKNAADAAYLLNTFKAVNGQSEPRGSSVQADRNQRLKQSISVPSRRAMRREVPDDDFDLAFDTAVRSRSR